jgi:hypothetical protein
VGATQGSCNLQQQDLNAALVVARELAHMLVLVQAVQGAVSLVAPGVLPSHGRRQQSDNSPW